MKPNYIFDVKQESDLNILSNNVQLDLNTGHHAAVGVGHSGGGVVLSTTEEPSNDVWNLRDLDHDGVSASVGAGVQRGGASLAIREVGGAEEVSELGQQMISIVFTVK